MFPVWLHEAEGYVSNPDLKLKTETEFASLNLRSKFLEKQNFIFSVIFFSWAAARNFGELFDDGFGGDVLVFCEEVHFTGIVNPHGPVSGTGLLWGGCFPLILFFLSSIPSFQDQNLNHKFNSKFMKQFSKFKCKKYI